MTCEHWSDGRYCGATDSVRRYLPGLRCPDHTPAKLTGREDIVPDPARTLDALRAAAGVVYRYRETDTALIDQRAIAASGGRRPKSAAEYKLARDEEDRRKQARRQARRPARAAEVSRPTTPAPSHDLDLFGEDT